MSQSFHAEAVKWVIPTISEDVNFKLNIVEFILTIKLSIEKKYKKSPQ